MFNIKGKLDGLKREFFPSGQMRMFLEYKDDQMDGPAKSYDEAGRLIWDRTYVDGKLEGVARQYFPVSGEVRFESYYEKDKLRRRIEYTRDGKVFSDETFEGEEAPPLLPEDAIYQPEPKEPEYRTLDLKM